MAGGVGGNSIRTDVLPSPRSGLHSVSRPEPVFQDTKGVGGALILIFLNQSRV